MAERKIPSNMQPWKANINGKDYEYPSGITMDVPEEVAALIDGLENSEGKPDPRASQRGIEKDVTQIVKDNFAGGVGYEETTEVVMLPETSFEIVAGSPDTIISDSFPYTFEVGQDYTVTLDGEAKTYTAIAFEGGLGSLTNTSLNDFVAGNGWLILASEESCVITTTDPSLVGTHTISISSTLTVAHKIDEKYIPNEPILLNKNFYDSTGELQLKEVVKAFNLGRTIILQDSGVEAIDGLGTHGSRLLYCGYSKTAGFTFNWMESGYVYNVTGSPNNWTKSVCRLTYS